jgi:Sigma-70 factor, region 1.
MEHWLESDELRILIESGRQRGYVTIEQLLAAMPDIELEPDAIDSALAHLESQGVRVLDEADATERELRQATERADRFIEAVEREEIDDAVQWWAHQARARAAAVPPSRSANWRSAPRKAMIMPANNLCRRTCAWSSPSPNTTRGAGCR